jgi:hypothetical protein
MTGDIDRPEYRRRLSPKRRRRMRRRGMVTVAALLVEMFVLFLAVLSIGEGDGSRALVLIVGAVWIVVALLTVRTFGQFFDRRDRATRLE